MVTFPVADYILTTGTVVKKHRTISSQGKFETNDIFIDKDFAEDHTDA